MPLTLSILALIFFFLSVGFTIKVIIIGANLDKVADGRRSAYVGTWIASICWTATAFFANWFGLLS